MTYLSRPQVDKLLAPINPQRVNRDPKGFSYVEAYELRAMMNRIFGFGRWSQDVVDQQPVFETETEVNGKPRWTICYRSLVRVTVCAPDGTVLATFTEGATGEATNQPGHGDAVDLALKTSQSQAFKRAVANLGDAFGLSLWGNGSTKPIVYQTLHYPFDGEKTEPVEVDAHVTEVIPEGAADWYADITARIKDTLSSTVVAALKAEAQRKGPEQGLSPEGVAGLVELCDTALDMLSLPGQPQEALL